MMGPEGRRRRVRHWMGALLVAIGGVLLSGVGWGLTAQVTVTGSVVAAESGQPVAGASVQVAETDRGTLTGSDGSFELSVADLSATLIVSYMGFERREVSLQGQQTVTIELNRAPIDLDALVVVGYGTQRRRDLTGSVASIQQADIAQLPVYSLENVLQGLAAGVDVSADGFRPGESSTIRVRGTRSLSANNDPLFVIDGVPVEGGIMDLNPGDIESIEVLKDASSTAIYGSRGANGVILVTTRRGSEGATQVSLSSSVGTQRVTRMIEMMDAQRYAEMKRQAEKHQGTYTTDEALFEPFEVRALQDGTSIDWQGLVYRPGSQQDHQLSVTGGTADTRVSIMGSYSWHDAVAPNNDFARYSARVNLDHQATDAIQLGVSAHLSRSVTHRGGSISRVMRVNPMAPPHDEEGNLVFLPAGDPFQENPLFDFDRSNYLDERRRSRVLANLFGRVQLAEGLRYRLNFAPDLTFVRNGRFRGSETIANALGPADARVQNRQTSSYLVENIMDWDWFRGDDHHLQLTGLYSFQVYSDEESSITVRDLPYEHQGFHNLGTALEVPERSSALREWRLESYMLRANYNFRSRWLATLTGRLDGSSRLADGNKYGFFPSAAVAWRVIEEPFLAGLESVTDLKVRLSYGATGNTAIQPYQTQGSLGRIGYNFGDQSVFGFQNREIANPDLQWETTRELNLGIDYGFLNNRIFGALDLYRANTDNLLMPRALPTTSGFTGIIENVGSTQNTGLELSISSVNVATAGGFTWSTDAKFAANRNRIVSLYGGLDSDPGNGWFIGHPIDVHYDFRFAGIWQLDEAEEAERFGFIPGDIKIADLNEDGRISSDDRMILGSPYPDWTLGLNNRFGYGGVDLSFMIYTAQGVMVNSAAYGAGMNPLRARYNSRDVNFWTPENPSNEYPRPQYENRGSFQNALNYRDGSYLRVRNISLGYVIPRALTERLGTSNARLNVTAQNPFTFTRFEGYDPEGATGNDMPNFRSFLVGLDVTF